MPYCTGDELSAGQSDCGGSTVMYINRGREDEMASEFLLHCAPFEVKVKYRSPN